MKTKTLLPILLGLCAELITSPAQTQSVVQYLVADTNVVGQVSVDWPCDTSWVFQPIYDERVELPNPVVIEVRRLPSSPTPLTRYKLSGDTISTSQFYSNGQLKVQNTSIRYGAWLTTEEFHPNGQLHMRMDIKSDSLQHGLVFYANGRKEREYWWNGGRLFNDFTEWYGDGQLKLEAHYEQWPLTEPPYRMSLPVGAWHYFMPNGDLEKVEIYDNGKLKETRTK